MFKAIRAVDDQAGSRRLAESAKLRTNSRIIRISGIAVSKASEHVIGDDIGELDVVAARRVVKIWPLDDARLSRRDVSAEVVMHGDDGAMRSSVQIRVSLIEKQSTRFLRNGAPLVQLPQQRAITQRKQVVRAGQGRRFHDGRSVDDGCAPRERQPIDQRVKIMSERAKRFEIECRKWVAETRVNVRHAKIVRPNLDLPPLFSPKIRSLEAIHGAIDFQPVVITGSDSKQDDPRLRAVQVERTGFIGIEGEHIVHSRQTAQMASPFDGFPLR